MRKSHLTGYAVLILIVLIAGLSFCDNDIDHGELSDSAGIEVSTNDIRVCFSPNNGCRDLILRELESADSLIVLAIYSFTSFELARALVEAKGRGVEVRVVTDEGQNQGKYSKTEYLVDSDIPLRYRSGDGCMHHKFAVIDDEITITGSYNWSQSAEVRNDENLLIIDSKDLAKQYSNEFYQLWEECR